MAERIALQAPLQDEFGPVVRLIVAGIAERAGFGFEEMDDLQLAIERLLAEVGSDGRVSMSFDLSPGRIRASVGPLHEMGLSRALQEPDGVPGELTLRKILNTVVDSFGVEGAAGGKIMVRLEKLTGPGA